MSWSIKMVYTLPQPSVIDFFKGISEDGGIYLVGDLEGIQSSYTQSVIFSDVPTEGSARRHGLPDGGLLAVKPDAITPSFEKSATSIQKETISSNAGGIGELPAVLELNESHLKLFVLLKRLNDETQVPIMYYQCATWGGTPDEEFSVVFDGDIFIYWQDIDAGNAFQLSGNHSMGIQTSVLQKGLEHVGLSLPTYFFALHERDFDWKRYQV